MFRDNAKHLVELSNSIKCHKIEMQMNGKHTQHATWTIVEHCLHLNRVIRRKGEPLVPRRQAYEMEREEECMMNRSYGEVEQKAGDGA